MTHTNGSPDSTGTTDNDRERPAAAAAEADTAPEPEPVSDPRSQPPLPDGLETLAAFDLDQLKAQYTETSNPATRALLATVIEEPDPKLQRLFSLLLSTLRENPVAAEQVIATIRRLAPASERFWVLRGLPFANENAGKNSTAFVAGYREADAVGRTRAFTTMLTITIDLMLEQVRATVRARGGREPFPILLMRFLALSEPQELRVLLMLTHKNIMEQAHERAEAFFALAEKQWPRSQGVIFLRATKEYGDQSRSLSKAEKKSILKRVRMARAKASGDQAELCTRMLAMLKRSM